MLSYSYRFYGLSFETDIPFPGLGSLSQKLQRGGNRIVFRALRRPFPLPLGRRFSAEGFSCAWSPDFRFARMHNPSVGTYRLDFLKKAIHWTPPKGPRQSGQSVPTQGSLTLKVLSLMLSHINRWLVLHGCVLEIDGYAVGFLGPSGWGKSTLAANFLNHGFPLLADDLALIQPMRRSRFYIQPGPREIRLWPQSARGLNFGRGREGAVCPEFPKKRFSLGHPSGSNANGRTKPLRAFYILCRKNRGGGIRIENLNGREKLLAIFENFYNSIQKDPKILDRQFRSAAQLADSISVKRLHYPSGFKHLSKVRLAVLRDLRSQGFKTKAPKKS